MIQLKLMRVLLDLVMAEGAFKRFGRLGPNHCASWYHGDHCSPWGLGHPPQLGLGDVLSIGLHQNLPVVFGMGYLLNDFIPIFL